jgi:hypothetical protein
MNQPTALSTVFRSHVLASRAEHLTHPESYTDATFSSLTQAPYLTRKADLKPFGQMQAPVLPKKQLETVNDLPADSPFRLP